MTSTINDKYCAGRLLLTGYIYIYIYNSELKKNLKFEEFLDDAPSLNFFFVECPSYIKIYFFYFIIKFKINFLNPSSPSSIVD